jgi:hypothetical protein
MRSFIDLDRTFAGQPRELGPILARVDTGRGREQLFLDQVPEVLKQLSENARIASITTTRRQSPLNDPCATLGQTTPPRLAPTRPDSRPAALVTAPAPAAA